MSADSEAGRVSGKADSHRREETPRPRWREMVAAGLYHSGALACLRELSHRYEFAPDNRGKGRHLRRVRQPKYAILCYHRVGTGGIPLFSELLPELFDAQMKYLRSHYRVVSLNELCEAIESRQENEHSVAVTFDDGYADLFAHAMPILERYAVPATIYLPVASIETGEVPWYDRIFLALKVYPGNEFEITLDGLQKFRLNSQEARLGTAAKIIGYLRTISDTRRREYCREIEERVALPGEELQGRMLNWDQIRTMSRSGVSFGSHTMTHPVVSRLTSSELESELRDSKELLERRLDTPVVHFAFPFGHLEDCGTRAMTVLRQQGYRSATTTIEGVNSRSDNLYALRRTQIVNEPSISMYAFKLNQLFLAPGGDQGA